MRHILTLIFLFFTVSVLAESSASAITNLPPHSRLLKVDDRHIHINERGRGEGRKTVVLISGPTDHWHADSAWFSMLLPALAKRYHVIGIDRPGTAWSDQHRNASYVSFADDLAKVLTQLKIKAVRLVGFASANMTIQTFAQRYHKTLRIDGVVLVDPDALSDEVIAFYKKDAAPFKKNLEKYETYIGAGKYTARTQEILAKERAEVQKLVAGPFADDMDWTYFDAIMHKRETVERQKNKFQQVAHYGEDLDNAKQYQLPEAIPLVIIDTNFELANLDKAKTDAEKQRLKDWESGSRAWNLAQVKHSKRGTYLPISLKNHLAPLFNVSLIEASIAITD